MIDLRSDTLSMPCKEMLQTILSASLGDDGRVGVDGKGEDATVNELEYMAAELTGKESALIMNSGTMANTVALVTHCTAGDKVLLDPLQHTYRTEKIAFDKNFGQLQPIFYDLTKEGLPCLTSVKEHLQKESIKLLCVENTHNSLGGKALPLDMLQKIRDIADTADIPVHMDGARLFNAALALKTRVKEICKYPDTLMFCLSKGLGAPIGAVLCGSREFIDKARGQRKLLGGNMRQAGIIAAPGIYALQNNVQGLQIDHDNASLLAKGLSDLQVLHVVAEPESNIVMLDTFDTGLTATEVANLLKKAGLWVLTSGDRQVRLVFYRGITHEMTVQAIEIVKTVDRELKK